ncbi:MAG TPA: FAD-binding protein [Bacteroidales bacterium]|nr:FAD-binding protein [Bacteroidales bacterium]
MADTKTYFIGQWDTFHSNGPFATKILYDTRLERPEIMPSLTDRYNDAAHEVQQLIQECIANNDRFRAYGSGWSLSDIAHQPDRMLYTGRMNLKRTIDPYELHNASVFKSQDLFFFQCGTTIKEISEFLFSHGKSLKTSGASNGQTIGGSISTGIHGSAFDTGAVQDSVAGLNLIIGPGPNDNVYIERHTQPALNDDFARLINARVIRNDGLFNAALVGLGSFGFIHGVLIEADDLFLLKRYTRRIKPAVALKLAETMNFRDSEFKIPSELDATGKGIRPYHFKVYVNPYNKKEEYITEIIYKKEYRTNYPNPIPDIKKAIYKDLPTWMARFAEKHSRLIPKFIGALKGQIFPDLDKDIEGTLGEIFWDTTHKGAAFAFTFGIDIKDTRKALNLFIRVVNEEGPVPGAIALRFIRASKAILAFTKFPMTCILEMDGILWKGSSTMISFEDFQKKLLEVFIAEGIKFTIHWGKNAASSLPGLIDYMYGDNDDIWKNYRSALLSKQMADVFSNGFLDTIRLSDYRVNVPKNLVDSLI